jgi:hypothetical protein
MLFVGVAVEPGRVVLDQVAEAALYKVRPKGKENLDSNREENKEKKT